VAEPFRRSVPLFVLALSVPVIQLDGRLAATPSGFCPRRKMPRSVFVWVVQPTAGSRKFAEKAGAAQPNCVVTEDAL
jgi:hypothetical protein